MRESPVLIDLQKVIKIYKTKSIEVVALTGLDLCIREGEIVSIVGSSGSGKSTLLNLLGGLDQATAGRMTVCEADMNAMGPAALARYRKRTVGFVWQNTARNLVPYLSPLENVELAMKIGGRTNRLWARELLARGGISPSLHIAVGKMSGGEQQRVGLAVALANKPRILLADEPTGALDTKTASSLFNLIRGMRDDMGLTVLIATHDARLAAATERTVAIRDGRITEESCGGNGIAVELEESAPETRKTYVLMDAQGRLQLPQELLESLHMHANGRLLANADHGRIILSLPEKTL